MNSSRSVTKGHNFIKLFTTLLVHTCKEVNLDQLGLNIKGGKFSYLRCINDVTLQLIVGEGFKILEKLYTFSLKVDLKINTLKTLLRTILVFSQNDSIEIKTHVL